MSTATATIETLAAEVRTLVVGARQVTLSMAKQLDVVPYVELEPMGRVRLSDGDRIIGRQITTGALALAKPPYRETLQTPNGSHAYARDASDIYPAGPDALHARQAEAMALPLIVLGLR